MHVAALRLEIRVKKCPAAGAKRRRVLAIMAKLHRHFNISIAEVDRRDHPCESVLAVAAVAATRREAREPLGRVADALAVHPRVELLARELIEV
jgi:uncharacterized protein YlxP (DUF503 family)